MLETENVVLGGSISGRIVKYFFKNALVLEAKPELRSDDTVNNLGANYLWKPIEGFKCRQIKVITHVDSQPANRATILAYKAKVGKVTEDPRRWEEQFAITQTGYLIDKTPQQEIQYSCEVESIHTDDKVVIFKSETGFNQVKYRRLFSTLPLPILLNLLRFNIDQHSSWRDEIKSSLRYAPIFLRITPTPPDSIPRGPHDMYVNYCSSPETPVYRYSDKNGQRHYESLTALGFPHKKVFPGKIYENLKATEFVKKLGLEYAIYCYGRYARWEPDELVTNTYESVENFYKEKIGE